MSTSRSRLADAPFLQLLALFIGIFGIVATAGKGKSFSAPSPLLLSPPENLKYFSLGYNESISDALWLRVIQDIDICEMANKSVIPVQHPGDVANLPSSRVKCNKGWPFRMLLAITELTPKFKIPYTAGGITLSVLGEDRDGASIIFERGLKVFPDDWGLLYKASYHYMYEEKNPQRASELLLEAGKNGAPRWVFQLAARLMSETGRMELAESVMKEQIENARNEAEKRSFEAKLEELRAAYKTSK